MIHFRNRMLWAALAVIAGCGTARLNDEPEKPATGPNVATADQWSGQNAADAQELFEGRFPGVQVSRTPDGIAVRIRGASSLYGENEPLYVVDGMTIQPGPGGALVGINPGDIEKIEVLKDIGSTAMYGSRGANGVILIKTKRAK
jgi:iron complex outermembrane receptor protein